MRRTLISDGGKQMHKEFHVRNLLESCRLEDRDENHKIMLRIE